MASGSPRRVTCLPLIRSMSLWTMLSCADNSSISTARRPGRLSVRSAARILSMHYGSLLTPAVEVAGAMPPSVRLYRVWAAWTCLATLAFYLP